MDVYDLVKTKEWIHTIKKCSFCSFSKKIQHTNTPTSPMLCYEKIFNILIFFWYFPYFVFSLVHCFHFLYIKNQPFYFLLLLLSSSNVVHKNDTRPILIFINKIIFKTIFYFIITFFLQSFSSVYNNKLRLTYVACIFMYTIMCRVSEPYNNSAEEEIKQIEKTMNVNFMNK